MKPLDQWARDYGYNDFDTYVRAGGSRSEAMLDLSRRIKRLQAALDALVDERVHDFSERIEHMQAALKEAQPQTEADDEPPDPDNAHPQGAEHEG